MRWIIVLVFAAMATGQATRPSNPLLNENSKLRAENIRLKTQIGNLANEVQMLQEKIA